MDRKSISILVICFAIMVIGKPLVDHFFPPLPAPTNVVTTATSPLLAEGTNATSTAATAAAPLGQPVFFGGSNSPAPYIVHLDIPEQLEVVTNENARYTFTSRGGGLRGVELVRYAETVSSLRHKKSQFADVATLNTPVAPPVLSILGSGADPLQDDGSFTLTRTNGGIVATKTLAEGLTLRKEFQIGTDYLVTATVRLENHTAHAIDLPPQNWIVGTATPMGPQDNGQLVSVLWYDGNRTAPVSLQYFNTNPTAFFFFPRTVQREYRIGSSNVVWVSAQNQFFTMATMLTNPAPLLSVHMVTLPPPSQEEIDSAPRIVRAPMGLQAALVYPGQTLAKDDTVVRSFSFYMGPKENHTLVRISERFNNNIDWVMNFNGFIGSFAKALLGSMNWLHKTASVPYGWAIVLITVIIKGVFWPLTQYSTRSMKRMQALAPQMKAMQEKYKDDPQKMQQKTWEFYKKNKVNPMSGCLPMLLQLPLLWGFYRMLQSAIELRGAPFLWIGDLSKPDTVLVIPGFNFPINPMPLLMGATMLWQSHLTPPSPGMDPGQQKLMRYMPLMFLVFMYNFSSGLALYWTVQNLLSVLQTTLIKNSSVNTPGAPGTATPAVATVVPQKKKK